MISKGWALAICLMISWSIWRGITVFRSRSVILKCPTNAPGSKRLKEIEDIMHSSVIRHQEKARIILDGREWLLTKLTHQVHQDGLCWQQGAPVHHAQCDCRQGDSQGSSKCFDKGIHSQPLDSKSSVWSYNLMHVVITSIKGGGWKASHPWHGGSWFSHRGRGHERWQSLCSQG